MIARFLYPLLALAFVAAGCGSKRRDWTRCNDASACKVGSMCVDNRCVPVPDGGVEARPPADAGADRPGIGDAAAPDAVGDRPSPDATPPDAAGSCTGPAHCGGDAGRCVSNRCVQCGGDEHCPDDRPACVGNACVGCGQGSDPMLCGKRSPQRPQCDRTSGVCVQCTAPAHCTMAGAPICKDGSCVPCQMAPAMCPAATPHCNTTTGACVECLQSAQCTAATRPLCMGTACASCAAGPADFCQTRNARLPACGPTGECVECTTNAHCTQDPARPVCSANRCVRCSRDADCAGRGPGVCMAHENGRCASDAETIYVQYNDGCAANPPRTGASDAPFCAPQAAIGALSATRRVIVLRGPGLLEGFSATLSGPAVTIVGQAGAAVRPGGMNPAMRIVSGDLYVRGVTFKEGSDVGVILESAATARITRCTIEKNAKGGLQINGAAFEVTNTVITGNGPGEAGAIVWGGALISPPVGKMARFVSNTVMGNAGPGLVCSAAVNATANIVAGNNAVQVGAACSTASCCDGTGVGANFRLMSGSACVDRVPPGMAAPDDIDGEARPKGAMSDCGADEL